jgi:two-component system response regulator (stage 0 sporulation protein A)
MTKKIKNTLKDLGIMPNVKGYHYLATGIELCINEFKTHGRVDSWMWIYTKIAKAYDTTVARVERCIRSAIDKAMRTELYQKVILEHTASAFIALVAEYIMEEM